MVEKNRLLLGMIDDGFSIQDIRNKLGMDYKELNVRLNQIKRCGYDFIRHYTNNGEIIYNINREINPYDSNNYTDIEVKEHTSGFHFIAISDTHFGHINDSIDMIYKLYDYALNNEINSIVNAGDFVEGDYTTPKYLRNKSIGQQVNYVVKNYPYDDRIVNHILLGNHDYHSFSYEGLNLMNVFNNKRYDLNVLGYGCHTLKVKNVNINVRHQIGAPFLDNPPKSDLTLLGHSHNLKMEISNNAVINLPTCSMVAPGNDDFDKYIAGALDINLKLQNNTPKVIEIKELEVNEKVKVKNVITYRIGVIKNNSKK